MIGGFIEGLVKYPDDLPCPQADTDLVPRERRYISDISDVRNMRMFQQEFQATRNRITFIFTEEEVRQFREWYEVEIIFGGAWFYADWPTLHKDKKIAHRFVGQPKYEWLFGGNPGMMGRSSAGVKYAQAPMAVPMYKVTATVELYDPRKVGKFANIYTSKLYPVIVVDDVKAQNTFAEASYPPVAMYTDDATLRAHIIVDAEWQERRVDATPSDDATIFQHKIVSGTWTETLLTKGFSDDAQINQHSIVGGEWTAKLITYPYYNEDDATIQAHVIVAAEWVT